MRLADEIQALFEEAMRELDRLALTEVQSATFSIGNWLARLWPRMPCEGWQDELDRMLNDFARNQLFITDQSRADIIAWVTAANEEAKQDALLPGGTGPRLVDICYGPRPQPAALSSPYDKPAPLDPEYPELRRLGHLIMEQFPPAHWLSLGTNSLKRHSAPEEVAKVFLQWLEDEQRRSLGQEAAGNGDAGTALVAVAQAVPPAAAEPGGEVPAEEVPVVIPAAANRELIRQLRLLGAGIMRNNPPKEWLDRAKLAVKSLGLPMDVERDFLEWIASAQAQRQHLSNIVGAPRAVTPADAFRGLISQEEAEHKPFLYYRITQLDKLFADLYSTALPHVSQFVPEPRASDPMFVGRDDSIHYPAGPRGEMQIWGETAVHEAIHALVDARGISISARDEEGVTAVIDVFLERQFLRLGNFEDAIKARQRSEKELEEDWLKIWSGPQAMQQSLFSQQFVYWKWATFYTGNWGQSAVTNDDVLRERDVLGVYVFADVLASAYHDLAWKNGYRYAKFNVPVGVPSGLRLK